MSLFENLSEFAGKRVEDWDAEGRITDPQVVAYRVRIAYGDDDSWADRFQSLLDDPRVGELQGLVIGQWTEDSGVDSGALVKPLLASVGGRGGGSPRIAQGSVPSVEAVEMVVSSLLNR